MNRIVRQLVPSEFRGKLVLEQLNDQILVRVGESAAIHENRWYTYIHWILVMFNKGTLKDKEIAVQAAEWVDDFKYDERVSMDMCIAGQERYRTVVDIETMKMETTFLQIVLE